MRAEQYLAPETLAQLGPFELRAKRIAEGVMSGMHRSPYQGLAVEFAEHRQYVAGDPVRHIDWKVFGRSDKLYLKRFQQETNLDVHILVDASGSMRFGTLDVKQGWGGTRTDKPGDWTKYDHATAAAAAMSFMCLAQRDRVSVALYAEGAVASTRIGIFSTGCSPAPGTTRASTTQSLCARAQQVRMSPALASACDKALSWCGPCSTWPSSRRLLHEPQAPSRQP